MAKHSFFLFAFALSFITSIFCLVQMRATRSPVGRCMQALLLCNMLFTSACSLALFGKSGALIRAGLLLKQLFAVWFFYLLFAYARLSADAPSPCSAIRTGMLTVASLDSVLLAAGLFIPAAFRVYPVTIQTAGFAVERTTWYFLSLAACCLLAAVALFCLASVFLRSPRPFRRKYFPAFAALVAAVALYVSASFMQISGLHYALCVIAFSAVPCLLYAFMFHFRPVWFASKINSMMVEHAEGGVLAFSEQDLLFSFNRSCASLFSLTRDQLGKYTRTQFLSDFGFPTPSEIDQAPDFSYSLTQGEGTRHFEVRFQALADEKGRHFGSYFSFREDTAHRAMLARQRFLATYDHLTGIPNRSFFLEQTEQMLHSHPNIRFALVSFDVDNFKIINELFGNRAGDLSLKAIASLLQTTFPSWTYARFDTDHFAFCVPESELNLKELSAAISSSIRGIGLPLDMQASFGIYSVSDPTAPVEQMCNWAAMAAETVKDSYLDYYSYYGSGLREQMLQEQEIISDLGFALADHQFEIFLQPQYNHVTKEIVGAEALIRWNHPERGYISPGQFIPVFEKNGFITQLDQHVWESVCRCLRRWADENSPLKEMPISVNISRLDFYRTDLCNIFFSLIEQYQLKPHQLKLEITESAYIDEPQHVIDAIKKLREYGFTIQMDDFGSGYSSLNTLKNMPVDLLKLDMKFLTDEGDTHKGGNILHSIIRMANWINLPVIAEGVETKAQADYLSSIGCEIVQGYYYSRPMPIPDFERLYASGVNVSPQSEEEDNISRELLQDLWDPSSQTTRFFGAVLGAAAIVEFFNNNLELLRASERFFTICGFDPAVIDSRRIHLLDVIHADDRSAYVSMLREAAMTHEWASCESRWDLGQGSSVWLDTRAQLLASHGRRRTFCLIFQNITEKKVNHDRTNAETKLLLSAMPHLPCIIAVLELGDRLQALYVHTCLHEGRRAWLTKENFIDALHPDDRAQLAEHLQSAVQDEADVSVKLRFSSDGVSYRLLNLHARGRRESSRTLFYTVIVLET